MWWGVSGLAGNAENQNLLGQTVTRGSMSSCYYLSPQNQNIPKYTLFVEDNFYNCVTIVEFQMLHIDQIKNTAIIQLDKLNIEKVKNTKPCIY